METHIPIRQGWIIFWHSNTSSSLSSLRTTPYLLLKNGSCCYDYRGHRILDKRDKQQVMIFADDTEVERVLNISKDRIEFEKDLGVLVDHGVNMSQLCNVVAKKRGGGNSTTLLWSHFTWNIVSSSRHQNLRRILISMNMSKESRVVKV